jgi:hypothetical protein
LTECIVVKHEAHIPKDLYERFRGLRPARKLIMFHYFQQYEETPKSPNQLVPKIAMDLGYVVDENASNSYILKVIQDFLKS